MAWPQIIQFLSRIILVALCLYGGHMLLADAHLEEAWSHMGSVTRHELLLALLLVALSYIALVGYDYLACRFLKQDVTLKNIAITAGLANAVSNMLGFALLSGGAVRLRCYTVLGVPVSAVAKISLFCTATFLLGLTLAATLGLAFDATPFSMMTGLSLPAIQTIGVSIMALCLLLPFAALKWKQVSWRDHDFDLPAPSIMWAQYGVGIIDILATGSVLYCLLPAQLMDQGLTYFAYITLFSAALWLGVVSHVPGGLGVFEAVMLAGLMAGQPENANLSGQILGALMLYRLLYFVLPFVIAVAVLAAQEGQRLWYRLGQPIKTPARVLLRLPDYFLPTLLAGMIALAGFVLLISGATPAATGRVAFLADFLPVYLIEGSHLLGSLVGLALLIVAHGLYQRFDTAYHATLALLTAGIIFSFFKGFDYEEAFLLCGMWILMATSRRLFYRRSKLSMLDIGWTWWCFIVLTLGVTIWLLFFAYRYVDYDQYLWWQIALDTSGDASRSLRSTVVLAVIALTLGIAQIFRPSATALEKPTSAEIEQAAIIVATSSSTTANLALTGDKYLLFSEDKDAFIMFGETARSLIAMGDPVGNSDRFQHLIWSLRELADRHHKRVAFYQVTDTYLPLYIDSGMQFARLGEKALVSIQDFSLDGSRYKDLRQALAKGERVGYRFEIVAPEHFASIETELRIVSDNWMRSKEVREKSFSLGHYDPAYLARFPTAIVRQNGRIIAFSNIWATTDKTELSIDLMRHMEDAPRGCMDYLFTQLLVWGQAEGYQYFNLGMAPLAGFTTHRLAPLWTQLGSFIFTHGERFYNFQGVHSFKDKYRPQWQPHYLAYRSGPSVLVLLDVAILIAGSFIGLFKK